MQKALGIVLVCALCCAVLTGCKKQSEPVQQALDFRTLVMGAEHCTYNTSVEADFGDRVYRFSLECDYQPADEATRVTVTAPDTIAGIEALVAGQTAKVTFEEVSLELGTMAGGHVAPMQLPQLLASAWTGGYIVSVGQTDEGWIGTYQLGYGDQQLEILTRFTAQDTPVAAEVYHESQCVLTASIDNFSIA